MRVFAVLVGLALVGGNAWLAWRAPGHRPLAALSASIGFPSLWAGVTGARGTALVAPTAAVFAAAFAYAGVALTRQWRRGRRPPPASGPPSPGP